MLSQISGNRNRNTSDSWAAQILVGGADVHGYRNEIQQCDPPPGDPDVHIDLWGPGKEVLSDASSLAAKKLKRVYDTAKGKIAYHRGSSMSKFPPTTRVIS